MRIYIPTLGRVNRQVTYSSLPPELQENTVLVVAAEEAKRYPKGVKVVVCPQQGTGNVGAVRQWVVANHDVRRYGAAVALLDDDLYLYQRRHDDRTKFAAPTAEEVVRAFAKCTQLTMEYGHGGLRHRELAHSAPTIEFAGRVIRAHFYEVTVLRKERVTFRLGAMEDFDVTLQLLRKGYPNFIYSELIQNQSGSGAVGGCSAYRTADYQAESAELLARHHPEFVKVVTKETKVAWGGGQRTDVNIAWKKAFKSSGAKLPGKEN